MPKFGLYNYNFGLVDFSGEPVNGIASITILDAGTQTTSTVYSDSAQTAKTNPIVTDLTNGVLSFWSGATSHDLIAVVNGTAVRMLGVTPTQHNLPIDINGVLFGSLAGSDTYEYLTAATKVLDIQDTGKIIVCTITTVVTLPAVATAGIYTLVCGAADGVGEISVTPAVGDMFHFPDIAGVDAHSMVNTLTTAKKGDFITIVGGLVSTGYVTSAKRGTWAKVDLT